MIGDIVCVKSAHIRTFPFAFNTETIRDAHSEHFTLLSVPLSTISQISSDTCSRKARGTGRPVCNASVCSR
uniref:Uncharacterized protein n=1 Tax=Lepeophtheirus salmonis TaxID=72036 RepID=A0A0K2TPC5_LEPSM